MTDGGVLTPGLYQIAYVVADLKAAMTAWTRRAKAGPWFIMRDFVGIDQRIDGVSDSATSTIALGQAGSTQIELIEVGPNSPKLYQEHVEQYGFFIRPTIVRDLPEDARLVQEEKFGPVLSVLSHDDIDDVIARANHSDFGLAGTVWGRDTARATQVAEQIYSGTV